MPIWSCDIRKGVHWINRKFRLRPFKIEYLDLWYNGNRTDLNKLKSNSWATTIYKWLITSLRQELQRAAIYKFLKYQHIYSGYQDGESEKNKKGLRNNKCTQSEGTGLLCPADIPFSECISECFLFIVCVHVFIVFFPLPPLGVATAKNWNKLKGSRQA